MACPTLVLWGARGAMGRQYDVGEIWRAYAADVTAATVPAGHFVAEEDPAGTLAVLEAFLA